MMIHRVNLMLVGAAIFAATNAAAQADAGSPRESLRAADRAVSAAAAQGLVDGLIPHLADSADVLAPGAGLLRGRDAARRWLASSPFAAARLSWEPVRVDVSADGRSGYSYGGGTLRDADGAARPARYIAFWNRGADGWRLAAFLFNANPRPVTPPPAGFFDAADARAQTTDCGDPAGALRAMMQADRDFAALSELESPGVAFATWAAPDAALLGGAYGPAAIRAAFGDGGGTLDWAPIRGGASGSGDLGYTVGHGVARSPEGQVGYSKYLTIWRLQRDGSWKWVIDGGNPRPADR